MEDFKITVLETITDINNRSNTSEIVTYLNAELLMQFIKLYTNDKDTELVNINIRLEDKYHTIITLNKYNASNNIKHNIVFNITDPALV